MDFLFRIQEKFLKQNFSFPLAGLIPPRSDFRLPASDLRPPTSASFINKQNDRINFPAYFFLIPFICLLQSRNVDFFHLQHGLHHPIGFYRVLVAQVFSQCLRNNLP